MTGKYRLPSLLRLTATLVEADPEDICRFLRGYYLDAYISASQDPWFPDMSQFPMGFLWRGAATRPGEWFADSFSDRGRQIHVAKGNIVPDPALKEGRPWHVIEPDGRQLRRRSYSIRGLERISRIASAPHLCLVENYEGETLDPGKARKLSLFLGRDVVEFTSYIGRWSMCTATDTLLPETDDILPAEVFEHYLVVHRWGGGEIPNFINEHRKVTNYFSYEYTRPRMLFKSLGQAMWFEDQGHYEKQQKKDRFNRNIVCEYLERLGVDPERTFLEHDVLDPMLLTYEPGGEPFEAHMEDLELYRSVQDRYDLRFQEAHDHYLDLQKIHTKS